MTKYKKGRIWACVGYPESLPIDWLEQLQQIGLQIAISPLHDKDIDPTGVFKKPHYHIIFNFDGPTTYQHVNEICEHFNMTIPIKLESLRGMYRYHIHLDNPEKYQYNDKDRILLGGFSRDSVEGLTATEIDMYTNEIITFIEDNDILEYYDLIKILYSSNMKDMLTVAKKNTILFTSFLKSKRNKFKLK